MKTSRKKKSVVVAVSGGFDPVHIGHIRFFRTARSLGDKLVVILNNDNWLTTKKGFVFMPEKERKAVIEAIRHVDRVIITKHGKNDPDRTIVRELKVLRPDIFANGGDTRKGNDEENRICLQYGIRPVYGAGGGKIQSSSALAARAHKHTRSTSARKR
jgi:D-beta-D-heptose 7-phosphate kinase/D-beta-D-heptose 1-phosphate adenosyltransferase